MQDGQSREGQLWEWGTLEPWNLVTPLVAKLGEFVLRRHDSESSYCRRLFSVDAVEIEWLESSVFGDVAIASNLPATEG